MKIFRRVLYAVLVIVLLGGLGEIVFLRPDDSEGQPLLLIAAMLGALIWSVVFLKEEPTLTRVALLMLLAAQVMFVLWAMQAQWTK